LPYFLEGGTPNVLGVAGLAAGIAWVAERGIDAARRHEVGLLEQVVEWAEVNEGWSIAGRWEPATHVGALSLIVPDGITPQELGGILDGSFDIAIRPGLHCSPYVHKAIGTFPDGTLRVSPGPFSTDVEIKAFLDALEAITAGVL
jgi:selenocysteine lyase/cysteine desulfurase